MEFVLLLGRARSDQLEQPTPVEELDRVRTRQAFCLLGKCRSGRENAAGDLVGCHRAKQLTDLGHSDRLRTPVLALHHAHRARGEIFRVQPDVDTAIGAVRLRLRLEPGLCEKPDPGSSPGKSIEGWRELPPLG